MKNPVNNNPLLDISKEQKSLDKIKAHLIQQKVRSSNEVNQMSSGEIIDLAIFMLSHYYQYDADLLRSQPSIYISNMFSDLFSKAARYTEYKTFNYCSSFIDSILFTPESKIYDTFTYNGELNLLNLRLSLLDKYVDYFVIVESDSTFMGMPKPLYFDINQHLEYYNKIIYVPVTDMPFQDVGKSGLAWMNEFFQRNSISAGLQNARSKDIIIVSDVDEIPNIQSKKSFIDTVVEDKILTTPCWHFAFSFDNGLCFSRDSRGECTALSIWANSKATSFGYLKEQEYSLNDIRAEQGGTRYWKHIGWHFSYVLNKEKIVDKILSYSHTDVAQHLEDANLLTPNKIIEEVCSGGSNFWPGESHLFSGGFARQNISDNNIYIPELSSYLSLHEDIMSQFMISSHCD